MQFDKRIFLRDEAYCTKRNQVLFFSCRNALNYSYILVESEIIHIICVNLFSDLTNWASLYFDLLFSCNVIRTYLQ